MKGKRLIQYCLFGILIYLLSVSCSMADSGQTEEAKEILVTFENSATNSQIEQAVDKANGNVEETCYSAGKETLVISLELEEDQNKTIRELERESGVASVQPNYIYTVDEESVSQDPLFTKQWNLDYMDVPEAWKLIDQIRPKRNRQDEDKVVVATLDTGIYYKHPDLRKNIDAENCVSVAGKEPPYEQYDKPLFSHGTGTGGIIGATSNNGIGMAGVAAGSNNDLISLMGIDVFQKDGYVSQAGASTADIIKGLEYACEKGAKVINMCLGHSAGDRDLYSAEHDDAALEAAINDAVYNKDVVITCSAGNKADSRPWYPSDFDAVISVINTTEYTNAWSKTCKARGSSYGRAKDISAPGGGVYKTRLDGTCGKGSGTSLAAPAVAGVAALVRYVNPQLSAAQVKNILYSTATDLYKPGYDIYTGHGNVNAYRAVAAAAGVKINHKEEDLMAPKSVKARSAGTNAIEISWQKVRRANGYLIYRASKRNGKYNLIRRTTDPSNLSIKDRGRKFNKKFFYKVAAYGTTKDGKKALSETGKKVSSRARSAVPKPKAANVDYRTIRLSWKKAKGADGYQVYRSSSKRGKYRLVKTIKKGSTTSWKNYSLEPGKKYYYKVRSYKLRKKKRYYSETSDLLVLKARPKKPFVSIKKRGKRIILEWKREKNGTVNGYKIYRKAENGRWRVIKTVKTKQCAYQDRRVIFGKTYLYKIRSYKKVGGKTVYSDYSKVKKTYM